MEDLQQAHVLRTFATVDPGIINPDASENRPHISNVISQVSFRLLDSIERIFLGLEVPRQREEVRTPVRATSRQRRRNRNCEAPTARPRQSKDMGGRARPSDWTVRRIWNVSSDSLRTSWRCTSTWCR